MFGWLTEKCPLQTKEKTWTETRMKWLADQLGIDRLIRADVILPNDEFFPEAYEATPEGAHLLFNKIAGIMQVDPGPIGFEVWPDDEMPGAAGHYDSSTGTTIRVAASQLDSPERLIATLAHELAHQVLLGGGLLTADVADHEWVTDLLPVYLGLGIFGANAVLREANYNNGTTAWWTIDRQGYLPARILGYAHALFAFVRGERDPAWASHLRLDAASALRDGLRYLHKTGDTQFHPDTVRTRRTLSIPELTDRLRADTPSARLAALWELRGRGTDAADAVVPVTACLTDRDPDIPGEAALNLAAVGAAAHSAVPQLREALWRGTDAGRAAAATALGQIGAEAKAVVPELAALLREEDSEVLTAVVAALRRFGRQAESAVPHMIAALQSALIKGDRDVIFGLVLALRDIAPDAERQVRRHFRAEDPELLREAVAAFAETRHAESDA